MGCGVVIGHLYQPIYVAPSDHHYQGVATPGCRFYQAGDTAISAVLRCAVCRVGDGGEVRVMGPDNL